MDYKNTLMYREISEQPAALKSAAAANAATLKELAKAIKIFAPVGAYLAARGTSDHACVYFKYLSETVWGLPAASAAPSAITLYGGKLDLTKQLVIAVSQSGKAADALEVIRRGKACGALTVSVTNDKTSPLAREADYHLFCAAGEEKSVAATKTFTTELLLLGLIVASVTGDRELSAELAAAGDVCAAALKTESAVTAAAEYLKSAGDCYVLGRGFVYSTVLETSLKLQETCYMRLKSYSTSDFVHGPFAALDSGARVLLIAPDDESKPDSAAMLKRLSAVGVDTVLLTDAKDLTAKTVLPLPECGRYNAVFGAAPVIQLLACSLSCLKGIGPDAPRGLNKVTVTK
ncbi:MAG: SIS domain-containing protein [Clostridiales bacterium]|jgi:glucosamine--fructose-6-phosphate aminotransferase (isomerizing)|nr:SIS domain-containing protein [Clostridiales bacterium]